MPFYAFTVFITTRKQKYNEKFKKYSNKLYKLGVITSLTKVGMLNH